MYDIVVIGGGHAGCEAALAAARLGSRTLMLAISLDSIAMMPCNPSIGGTSKGHLVKEIDALGGEMGKIIDKTYIQSKMLNTGKGPAVYSLRAQADKTKYAAEMKRALENANGLDIKQGEVKEIIVENGKVKGVKTTAGIIVYAKAVIICAGTYLNALCLTGELSVPTGPNGMKRSEELAGSLEKLGLKLLRFKTGTPARINRNSIDFTKMGVQEGDVDITPFSFANSIEEIRREQIPCHITYTTPETHRIIRENIHRSPMYSGKIEGAPTRYCPSIEDKVVRFADKDRHQIFIEPEGEGTAEMYVQGMSSSLPEDVQELVYRSIPGLENCVIMRPAYAIEYNALDATVLKLSLEFKDIKGLFSAGQINGSSGYEEAAAQGLIAGINAHREINGMEPLTIRRDEGYIGVLIDDLVTKGTREPYRMMTSRAEYRLLLRQDNADLRLREKGYEAGLVPRGTFLKLKEKEESISKEIERLNGVIVLPNDETNNCLAELGSAVIQTGIRLGELIKRPELSYAALAGLDPGRSKLPADVTAQVEIMLKYEGYIKRQERSAEQFRKAEGLRLPADVDYNGIGGLRNEAKQKLSSHRPENLGAASRITGVSPADISVLMVYMEKRRRDGN
ncbi:MAG: tRNA uridine-5-carboxymethylaminomethyl(34) synthesis enzyme MnmG [Defluviitaleaceae bacterium]|nr:tRNA uridine-5-carboxymethylaminomethyl(34) synthesis enzyme MnmG [Defluviitaleaceae bacterium]MCL2835941.1 tRNA uridine-5-carboxymethylaminomethyl(34) synthesis enzyme MnmG [Defluviitaleaceae bacterium]